MARRAVEDTQIKTSGSGCVVLKFKEVKSVRALGQKRRGRSGGRDPVQYQTQQWNNAVSLVMEEIGRTAETVTVKLLALDEWILCSWAHLFAFRANRRCRLIDNLGTSAGSRKVQLYNGRAIISVRLNTAML